MWIQLLIICLIISFGIFSFFKLKENSYFKKIKKEIRFIFFLPFLDVFSTILFVSKHGVEAEINPLGRFFMYSFGDLGYIFMYLLAITVWTTFFFLSSYLSFKYPSKSESNKESLFKTLYLVKGVAIGVYTIIVFYNFSSLFI